MLSSSLKRVVRLRLGKLFLTNPQDFWNTILWTDKIKVEIFGYNAQLYIRWKTKTEYYHKHLLPAVKHGGGEIKICACVADMTTTNLAVTELCITKCSGIKCEAICQTANTWWSCNRRKITAAKQQLNCWKEKELRCWNGQVKVPTKILQQDFTGLLRVRWKLSFLHDCTSIKRCNKRKLRKINTFTN